MFMQSREAVRVKVKKYNGKLPPELQKFSVDPQITSLEVLQSILAKAFNLKGDFSLSYKSVDDLGQEDYLALFSDWDLDAAFLRAQNASALHGTEPCVHLRVDVRPSLECAGEVETENQTSLSKRNFKQADIGSSGRLNNQDASEQRQIQTGFQGIFMNQMEKTLSMVSRALNLSEDPNIPIRQPLSDAEFRSFLDPVGQVIHGAKLREVIYCGGIDPSLRRVVWKHILNVYPDGMSGKQRMDYMKKKSAEYFQLRDVWRDCIQKGQVSGDLAYVTSMVKKDVLRTDRQHKFYAGSDDNQNIASLFNILTTYALNHPLVSYCQGMSDLASPLLVTMKDEAHAYICLCALMSRLYPNFLLDGEAMTLKFTHLTESLQVYDPQFYTYLKSQQADDLLFCYRWLLLEMKREFAFEDSLRMLEVLWSSLPPSPPFKELALKDKSFSPGLSSEGLDETPISPLVKTPRDNAYTKLCAMRRQNSSMSLTAATKTNIKIYKRMNQSLDENIGKSSSAPTTLIFSKEFQSLDDTTINTNLFQKANNTRNVHSESDASQNTHSENSLSESTTSLFQTDCELNNTNEVNNLGSLPESTNLDKICNTTSTSTSNHQNTEDTQKQISASKLHFQNKHFDENTPIKLIENFNEFKKLTSYKPINKKPIRKDGEKNLMDSRHVSLTSQSTDILQESEFEDSSPDDSKEYSPMTTSITRELKLEWENFDKQLCRQCSSKTIPSNSFDTDTLSEGLDYKCANSECDIHLNSLSNQENIKLHTNNGVKAATFSESDKILSKTCDSGTYDVFVWENPLHGNVPGREEIKANLKMKASLFISKDLNKEADDPGEEVNSTQDLEDALKSINVSSDEITEKTVMKCENETSRPNSKFFSNMSQELENARRNCEVMLCNKKGSNLQSIAATISSFQKKYDVQAQCSTATNADNSSINRFMAIGNICEEVPDPNDIKQLPSLMPTPDVFGGGNPFLMFLCLTVLMQHRDHIMRNHMDYNELAMYFDKMIRKHNVNRVLNQARRMYSQYLKLHNDN